MTGFYLTLKFLYKSLIDVNGTSTILDTNVHSNFQNFRMLHMTKAHDDETYLQPDEYSSDACIDHLIGCYMNGPSMIIDQTVQGHSRMLCSLRQQVQSMSTE
jgi:hypothetical protein